MLSQCWPRRLLEPLEHIEEQYLDMVRYAVGANLQGVRVTATVATIKAIL